MFGNKRLDELEISVNELKMHLKRLDDKVEQQGTVLQMQIDTLKSEMEILEIKSDNSFLLKEYDRLVEAVNRYPIRIMELKSMAELAIRRLNSEIIKYKENVRRYQTEDQELTDLLNTPIQNRWADIPGRISNTFDMVDIYLIGDLIQYKPENLIRLKNFGPLSVKQIVSFVEEAGLCFGIQYRYDNEMNLYIVDEKLSKKLYRKFSKTKKESHKDVDAGPSAE